MALARLRLPTLLAPLALLIWAPVGARAQDTGGTPAPVVVNVSVQVGAPAAPDAPAAAPTGAPAVTQTAPVNVAVQVVVNSPGASTNANQTNAATGGFHAPATPAMTTPSTPPTPHMPAIPTPVAP